MRHLKRKKRLTVSKGHRKALLENLAKSIFTHKRITTTYGKAKAAQAFVERIVTYAKKDGLHAYRMVESKLHDQRLVKRVVDEIAPNYKDRNGGYTRIIKAEPRVGDAAKMVVFELVGDFSLTEYPAKKKKSEKDDSSTEKASEKTAKKVVKKVVKKVKVDKKEDK